MTSEELAQLAGLQALYKAIGAAVSTRDAQSLRGRADSELREMFERAGVDRIRITGPDGTEFGRLVAKLTKESTRRRVVVRDLDLLLADRDMVDEFMGQHAHEFAEWLLSEGVVPDGCDVFEEAVPGGQWAGTTLTGCRPEVVLPALGVGRVAGYIEEG